MLLHVERTWIEETSNGSTPRNYQRHKLSQDIGYDCQKDYRDVDCLRFEVENLLKDGSKDREANPFTNCQSIRLPKLIIIAF
jgi:hypothetical protein